MGKSIKNKIVKTEILDLREYSNDRLKRCDDELYGGGRGMVLKPEPLFNCLESVITESTTVINMSPSGKPLTQDLVKELALKNEFCLICGHYEGIDQRVVDVFVDIEVSIGDYVLSGGEIAALAVIDAISRYEPGFMSSEDSLKEESFENDLLEYPHYTRPYDYKGNKVPDILLSGNHAKIEKWRMEKSIEKTKKVRPDLYKRYLKKKQEIKNEYC
jgi:tRNA (guanine37-N1)-methyltransferase